MRPLDGFPTSFGSERAAIFPHAGPASYTQVVATAGTVPATGGDSCAGSECGLKYFDQVAAGLTDDGAFLVIPFPRVASHPQPSGPYATYGLKWVSQVTATVGGQAQTAGAEAVAGTNLTGEVVRLIALGPK